MNITGFAFVLLTQFLAGRGLMALFNIRHGRALTFAVSNICGVLIFSLLPIALEMMHLPINKVNVGIAMSAITLALFLPKIRTYDFDVKRISFSRPQLYDIFFIALFVTLMIPSFWRCFYYPPFARDVLSGPEALAEFAIREHKIINSVFTVNLESTNNHLKPPFILDLQIIYKLFVHPFGQLWLSVLVISFFVWIYALLRKKLHALIVGIIMLFFITQPDPYAYTYIALFDYANAILYFAGCYYLSLYAEKRQFNYFAFSAMMFGFATSVRSETLLFIGMLGPLLLWMFWKERLSIGLMAKRFLVFFSIPFFFYYMWIGVFVTYYMPLTFAVDEQIAISSSRLHMLFDRFKGINTGFLFAGNGVQLYGYMLFVFLLVIISDAIFTRKFNMEARIMIYGILVIYLGLPVLGYLVPLVDLDNTTKRGLFKMFPLMLIYMRNSGVLTNLSQKLWSFEHVEKKRKLATIPETVPTAIKRKRK